MSGIDAPVFVPVASEAPEAPLTDAQLTELEKPLMRSAVKKRQGGGGKSLNYLEAHFVKRTANQIFTYRWSHSLDELICLGEEPVKSSSGKEGFRVGYRARVTVTIAGTFHGDVGYGDAVEYAGSRITPHENAAKEAVSDAIKRCLTCWGDRFGLVLYDKDRAA